MSMRRCGDSVDAIDDIVLSLQAYLAEKCMKWMLQQLQITSATWLQVFSKCAQVRDTVGLANCGISSCVAKDMHKKQGIYGTAAMA